MLGAVHYHLSDYISHRTAGLAAMRALDSAGVRLVPDPERADVLIIHDDPYFYPEFVDRYGGKKRIVAYCVWETDILPASFARNLQGVDAIWTCTPFSARAFERAGFDNVAVAPHVVAPAEPTDQEMEAVRARLAGLEGRFLFYTVVDSVNPRKNLEGLLQAYAKAFRTEDAIGNLVGLVVKQYRKAWDLDGLPGVVSITDRLTGGEMTALHRLCHAYASAHHAEAWGLPLSNAMHEGNPVVATGYSGNMFYMNASNSFPVRYELVPVSEAMCKLLPVFTPDMVWAEPDLDHMAYLMHKAARAGSDQRLSGLARAAVRDFQPDKIGTRMRELLEAL